MGAPAMGIEPWPLRWEPGVLPNTLQGNHEDKCLKTIPYTNFENFKELVGNLQAS